jgi:hypothetical protein
VAIRFVEGRQYSVATAAGKEGAMTGVLLGLSPKVKEELENRIKWINDVTELAAAENWPAVKEAIDEIDLEHLRLLIYILILARVGDRQKLHTLDARAERAPLN